MSVLKLLLLLLTTLLMSEPSVACISGRGIELRYVLNAEFVFRGELLTIGSTVPLEDDYYEQTLTFRITHSFRGPFSKGEIRDISFQYPLNPSRFSTVPEPEIQVGEGYTIVLNRLWKPEARDVDAAVTTSGTLDNSRFVHRWYRFACGGDHLRLRKNSHNHAKAIWMVFTGHSHSPEIRADVLTEFFGIDGRF